MSLNHAWRFKPTIYTLIIRCIYPLYAVILADINECTNTSGTMCEHDCVNLISSYECSCRSGYSIDINGFSCNGIVIKFVPVDVHLITPVDIDECQTNRGGCEHNCTNTEGSFNCLCLQGFVLASDGLQCDGK